MGEDEDGLNLNQFDGRIPIGQQLKFVKEIEDVIRQAGLEESEILECVTEVFGPSWPKRKRMGWATSLLPSVTSILWLSLIVVTSFTVISVHSPTQKRILRYSQDLIYPIMRQVRLSTIPLLKTFPGLTEYYEEECLISNPFYQNPELDCWPCTGVKIILELTGSKEISAAFVKREIPFITKDVLTHVISLDALMNLYKDNKFLLNSGTGRASLNNHDYSSMEDIFSRIPHEASNFHVRWKMQRVSSARVTRQFFARPHFVPSDSEVSLQRFVFVDGPKSEAYFIPMTDFANVWVAQAFGSRTIILDPVRTCRTNCSSLAITLQAMDILYYNWQFYSARSLPLRRDEGISLTFVGSFY
ncbi:hypothetical protein HDE_13409 [Halotydeus destructor]|nr:hypothetical protein HDE_13409 [Halotydeus destructor]